MSEANTVILSESEMPRMKNRHSPWRNPLDVTEEMTRLAYELIRFPDETEDFIQEVEGSCDFCGAENVRLVYGQCKNCTDLDENVGGVDV